MQLLCLAIRSSVLMALLVPLRHKKAAAVPPVASRSDLIQSTAQRGIFSRAPPSQAPSPSLAGSGIHQHSKLVGIPHPWRRVGTRSIDEAFMAGEREGRQGGQQAYSGGSRGWACWEDYSGMLGRLLRAKEQIPGQSMYVCRRAGEEPTVATALPSSFSSRLYTLCTCTQASHYTHTHTT